jgi:transcriptional regulator with XRE-family HTH domain
MKSILIALGGRIRELRKQRKWSQEEFADRCGLYRTAVGLLERAERIPRLDTLLTVSNGLEITVSELL